jgi:hypothetical protein
LAVRQNKRSEDGASDKTTAIANLYFNIKQNCKGQDTQIKPISSYSWIQRERGKKKHKDS